MNKRIIAILMALSMVMALAACGSSNDSSNANGDAGAAAVTGTATAQGFGGEVKVTVTKEGDKITSVVAEGADETEGVGSVALEELPKAMVENNTVEVDAHAGATITSNAILTAAAEAAKNAQ